MLVVAFAATLAIAVAPGGAATAAPIDGSAGALQTAGRMHNAKPTGAPAPAPTPELSAELQQVLNLTNAERTSRGLAPLVHNSLLGAAADAHSRDQAARGQLTHTGSDGSNPGQRISRAGYVWRTWAENAAAGYGSAGAVMAGWMGSSGHRANILNPNMTEVGLGIAYTSSGYPYWTQVFAAPR